MSDATDRAKDRSRAPGAPAVQVPSPNVRPPEQPAALQAQRRAQVARPVQAVAADLNRLADAIQKNDRPDPTPPEEAPPPPPETKAAEETEEPEEDKEEKDPLEESNNPNPLLDPRYKELVESLLTPLDPVELVTHGEIRQEVPILFHKDKTPLLKVTFRTVSGDEDLGVKYDMMGVEGTTRYIMDRFSIAQTCIGIHSIGGKELPTHLNKEGEFDKELFPKRLKAFLRRPQAVITALVQHYIWFSERIQGVGIAEALGNG